MRLHLAACALLVSLAARADASQVLALGLDELTSRADRVVLGEIVDLRSAWDAQRRHIFSTITVTVSESWKGDLVPGRRLTIVQPGGAVGKFQTIVHGMPAFAVGERAVLFVRAGDGGAVVGMSQGKRSLRFDGPAQTWMADPADRSAVVSIRADGRLAPATPEAPVPLNELRRRVKALVRR